MAADPEYVDFLVDRYGTPIERGTEILYVVGGDRPQFHDATVVDFTEASVIVQRKSEWESEKDAPPKRIRLQRPQDVWESDPNNPYRWLYDANGKPVAKPFSKQNPARLPYVIVHGTVVRRLDEDD